MNRTDVVEVFELGLADECGETEIALTEGFLAGGAVGTAVIGSRELFGPQFSRAMIRLEKRLIAFGPEKNGSMFVKLDIEGYETNFLEGGRKTIFSHRPVILMEVSRQHQKQRGIDFDTVVPSLLPDRYAFAELRSGRIVRIDGLAQCTDTDVLVIPEERLAGIDRQ
jgi:FkbM family methyltransferase